MSLSDIRFNASQSVREELLIAFTFFSISLASGNDTNHSFSAFNPNDDSNHGRQQTKANPTFPP